MEGMEVNSSIIEIEEFKKSILWDDIVRELKSWKEGFELERAGMVDSLAGSNISTAEFLTHLGSVDGRIKAVDYMLGLPDVFISILEFNNKEEVSDE